MFLKKGHETIEFLVGDTFITKEGQELLVISAAGFDLSDDGQKANYILVNVKYGDMEGYTDDLNDIWKWYDIDTVIPNQKSHERRNKKLKSTFQ